MSGESLQRAKRKVKVSRPLLQTECSEAQITCQDISTGTHAGDRESRTLTHAHTLADTLGYSHTCGQGHTDVYADMTERTHHMHTHRQMHTQEQRDTLKHIQRDMDLAWTSISGHDM